MAPTGKNTSHWKAAKKGAKSKPPSSKKAKRKDNQTPSLFAVGPKGKRWTNQTWDETYAQLVEFQREHGHCNVKACDNPRLGSWVTIQKGRNRAKLTPEQKQKLDDIGFCWDKSAARFDKKWEERFQELIQYNKKHGTTQVPKSRDGMDAVLADWVSKQRWQYHKKTLKRDRQEKLEEIGFLWVVDESKQWRAGRDVSKFENEWNDMFDKLVEFQRQYGHCLVPWIHSTRKKGKEDEFYSLGRWVRSQRTALKENRLHPKRQEKLDELGFVWTVDAESADTSLNQRQWDEMFQRLQTFRAKHGHTLVPAGYAEDPKLALWVDRQRYFSRNGSMIASRAERLEKIGFWVGRKYDEKTPDNHEHYNILWNKAFDKLKAYQKRFGHTRVPHDYSEDPHLGHWAYAQRALAAKGTIVDERKRKLNEMGFDWTILRP